MSLLAAAGAFAGDALGTAASMWHNERMQGKAQEFTKWQMGNTHQYEMEDLRKAGINPIYGVSKGGTPGVGGIPGVGAQDFGSNAMNAMNKKAERAVMEKQLGNIDADTEAKEADAYLKSEMANTEIAKQENMGADTTLKGGQNTLTQYQMQKMEAEAEKLFAEARTAKTEAESAEKNRRGREIINQLRGYTGAFKDIVGSGKDAIEATRGRKSSSTTNANVVTWKGNAR